MFRSVKGFSGMAQLGFLLVFSGLGFVLASITQLPIYMHILPKGVDISNISALKDAMADPRNVNYVRMAQVIGTFFFFFIPAWLFSLVVNGRNMYWLGFNRFFNGIQVLIAFFLITIASIAFEPLSDLTKIIISHFPRLDSYARELEDAYSDLVKVLSNLNS